MTVPNEVPFVDYVGNGTTKEFNVPFQYETPSTLFISVNGVTLSTSDYSFNPNTGNFVFYTAPASGAKVRIVRDTPEERDADYDDNYNTFRPRTLNKDFDRLWRVIQEHLVSINLNKDGLAQEILDRIQADEEMLDYIMNQDNAIKQDYIQRDSVINTASIERDNRIEQESKDRDASINSSSIQRDTDLKNYIDNLIALITGDPSFNGITTDFVTEDGETQRQKNDKVKRGIANKYDPALTYQVGNIVLLDNGTEVISTILNNTNDPNVDMTGWRPSSGFIDLTNRLWSGNTELVKTHNSTVINSAIALAKSLKLEIKCFYRDTVFVNSDLDFKGVQKIEFHADIRIDNNTVIIGGFASTPDPVDISFGRITNGSSAINGPIPEIDTVRFEGIKAGTVVIGQTNLLRIHAVGSDPSRGSNAYFRLFLDGSVRAFRVSDEGEGGWNNEFEVLGGRIIDLDVTGTGYTHNNILFDNNVFEGSLVKIRFKRAWTNRIVNARFENTRESAGIIFESDTMQNTVIQRWNGSGSTRGMFEFFPPVVDLGKGNQCATQSSIDFQSNALFDITQNSGIVGSVTETSSTDPKLHRTKSVFANKQVFTPALNGFTAQALRLICLTNLIEVRNGDAVNFQCDFDGNLLTPLIYIYDENQNLITTGVNHIQLAGGSFNTATGSYSTTADLGAVALRNGFSIDSDMVKFVQVGCYSRAGGFFRSISATLYTQKLYRNKTIGMIETPQSNLILNTMPTLGLVEVNTVAKIGGVDYYNSVDVTTNLAAAITSSNSITVRSATGISSGCLAGIMQSDGSTLWTNVTSVSGTSITLADPVTANLNAIMRVNKWVQAGSTASKVFDPPSIAAGASTTTTVTLTGASVGQLVQAAFSQYSADIEITPQVSAANTVTVKFKNTGASAVDLASGTLTVKLI